MKTRHSLAFLSMLIIALALIACARTRSDADLTGDVLTKVHADASLAASPVNVQTNNGVVVLSGTVPTDFARTAAENAAKQVPGVKGVVNNLQVVAAAAPPAPAPEMAKPSAQAIGQQPAKARPAVKKAQPSQPAAPVAAAPAPSQPAPAATPALPATVTIPTGTDIPVRLIDAVDTEKNKEGDTFRASLDAPIVFEDKTVIPKNADVEARLVSSKSAGRFAGSSQVVLVLTKITVGAKTYAIETGQFTKAGGSRGTRSAIVIGGGAAAGAIIGGLTGGKKGAAIGAAAGAGAGTGVQALTKGEQIKLPAETLLEFQLTAPLTVTPATAAERQKAG